MARTVQKARHWWATEAAKRKQRQQQLHSSGAISPRPGSIAAWQLAHNQPLTSPRPSVQTDSDSDSDSDDDLGHEAKEILSNMSPEFTELLGDGSDSDDEDSPHDAAAPPPAGRAVGESVSSEVSTVPEPEVPAAEVLAAQVTLELPVATCSDKTARPKSARARQRLAKRKHWPSGKQQVLVNIVILGTSCIRLLGNCRHGRLPMSGTLASIARPLFIITR